MPKSNGSSALNLGARHLDDTQEIPVDIEALEREVELLDKEGIVAETRPRVTDAMKGQPLSAEEAAEVDALLADAFTARTQELVEGVDYFMDGGHTATLAGKKIHILTDTPREAWDTIGDIALTLEANPDRGEQTQKVLNDLLIELQTRYPRHSMLRAVQDIFHDLGLIPSIRALQEAGDAFEKNDVSKSTVVVGKEAIVFDMSSPVTISKAMTEVKRALEKGNEIDQEGRGQLNVIAGDIVNNYSRNTQLQMQSHDLYMMIREMDHETNMFSLTELHVNEQRRRDMAEWKERIDDAAKAKKYDKAWYFARRAAEKYPEDFSVKAAALAIKIENYAYVMVVLDRQIKALKEQNNPSASKAAAKFLEIAQKRRGELIDIQQKIEELKKADKPEDALELMAVHAARYPRTLCLPYAELAESLGHHESARKYAENLSAILVPTPGNKMLRNRAEALSKKALEGQMAQAQAKLIVEQKAKRDEQLTGPRKTLEKTKQNPDIGNLFELMASRKFVRDNYPEDQEIQHEMDEGMKEVIRKTIVENPSYAPIRCTFEAIEKNNPRLLAGAMKKVNPDSKEAGYIRKHDLSRVVAEIPSEFKSRNLNALVTELAEGDDPLLALSIWLKNPLLITIHTIEEEITRPLEIPYRGRKVRLPRNDEEGAEEVLKELHKQLEVQPYITEEDERDILEFGQRVAEQYPDTTRLDPIMMEIEKTAEEKRSIFEDMPEFPENDVEAAKRWLEELKKRIAENESLSEGDLAYIKEINDKLKEFYPANGDLHQMMKELEPEETEEREAIVASTEGGDKDGDSNPDNQTPETPAAPATEVSVVREVSSTKRTNEDQTAIFRLPKTLDLSIGNFDIPDADSDVSKHVLEALVDKALKAKEFSEDDSDKIKKLVESIKNESIKQILGILSNYIVGKLGESGAIQLPPDSVNMSRIHTRLQFFLNSAKGRGNLETVLANMTAWEQVKDPDSTHMTGASEAERRAKFAEAVRTVPILEEIFLSERPDQTLSDKGYDIPSKDFLRKIVKEYLVEFATEEGVADIPIKTKGLELDSLTDHGVKTEDLERFAQGLERKLPKQEPALPATQSEATHEVDEGDRPTGMFDMRHLASQSVAPEPIPASEPPAPISSAVDDEASFADVNDEDLEEVPNEIPTHPGAEAPAQIPEPTPELSAEALAEKQIDELVEALKEEPKFKELLRLIFLLRGARLKHADLDDKREEAFGTKRISEVFAALEKLSPETYKLFADRKDQFFAGGEIDRHLVVKKLLEFGSNIQDKDDVAGLAEAILETLKAVQLPYRDTNRAPAPEPTPDPEPTPEPEPISEPESAPVEQPVVEPTPSVPSIEIPDLELPAKAPDSEIPTMSEPEEIEAPETKTRAHIPAELAALIEKTAKDEAEKERLLDLWEVAAGKAKLADKSIESDVKKMFEQVRRLLQDKDKASFAERRLSQILSLAEGTSPEALNESELSRDALRTMLLKLAEDNPKLKKRLQTLFEMLAVNPDEHGEDAYLLRSIQKDVMDILLNEAPKAMDIGACKDMAEFVANLEALGFRKQKKGMKALESMIMNDEELVDMVQTFNRIMKRVPDNDGGSDNGGGTPPPAGPAPSSGPSSEPAVSARPNVRPVAVPRVSVNTTVPSAINVATQAVEMRSGQVASMLRNFGFESSSKHPAIMAVVKRLTSSADVVNVDFAALEKFLKNSELTDEVDQLAREKSVTELEAEAATMRAQMESLDDQIRVGRLELQRLQRTQDIKKANDDLFDGGAVDQNIQRAKDKLAEFEQLRVQKEQLRTSISRYQSAIERKRQGKSPETTRYDNPEQLLGMINLYFETNRAKEKGETPDHMKVISDTHNQLYEARIERTGVMHHMGNLLTGGIIKPRLTNTLAAIAEKDAVLKKLEKGKLEELAKGWDDQSAVDAWINSLGNRQETMETIVPTIIGYLEAAVNGGRISHLNMVSLNRAKGLSHKLRQAIHKYALDNAKKVGGKGMQKMQHYFAAINSINEKTSTISRNILSQNTAITMARNAFIGTGMTLGGTALAGLSGIALATAGGLGVAGAAGLSSFRVEDPETKSMLRKAAVRATAVTGLAAGTAALGLAALPALALGGVAAFTPEFWKHRNQIANGTASGARMGAKVAVPVAGAGVRLGWGALGVALSGVTFGAALFNPRYRKFFGLPS